MKFSKWIKKLGKKGIIGRWPPVWVPFALAVVILVEGYFFPFEKFKCVMYYLAGFTFLYAIAHWKVMDILKGEP